MLDTIIEDESRRARIRLDEPMATWLLELVADERYELVRELHDVLDAFGKEAPEYQEKLIKVRAAEKVLRYIRRSMTEAGFLPSTTSRHRTRPQPTSTAAPGSLTVKSAEIDEAEHDRQIISDTSHTGNALSRVPD